MAYVASLEFSNSPTLKGCRVKCGGVSTTGDGTKMHSLRLDKEKIPKVGLFGILCGTRTNFPFNASQRCQKEMMIQLYRMPDMQLSQILYPLHGHQAFYFLQKIIWVIPSMQEPLCPGEDRQRLHG